MSDVNDTIPLEPQPLRTMYPRFENALCGTYDPASEQFVPKDERTRAIIRRHLFDFRDTMRLHVSCHTSTSVGTVIDGYGQWFDQDQQPAERVEAIKIVMTRMDDLIESLDHVDEAPAPIDYGMDEVDRPHVIYPYPSPAFSDHE